jgi:hypothetical protein
MMHGLLLGNCKHLTMTLTNKNVLRDCDWDSLQERADQVHLPREVGTTSGVFRQQLSKATAATVHFFVQFSRHTFGSRSMNILFCRFLQYKAMYTTYLPYLLHGVLDTKWDATAKKAVDNPDRASHVMLFSLLALVVRIVSARVLTRPAIRVAGTLMREYGRLFVHTFPEIKVVPNLHMVICHFEGTRSRLVFASSSA